LFSHNRFLVTLSDRVGETFCGCMFQQTHKTYDEEPAVLLQPLVVTEFRWQSVLVDCMTQLPDTAAGHAVIVVFVGRLRKMVPFAP